MSDEYIRAYDDVVHAAIKWYENGRPYYTDSTLTRTEWQLIEAVEHLKERQKQEA